MQSIQRIVQSGFIAVLLGAGAGASAAAAVDPINPTPTPESKAVDASGPSQLIGVQQMGVDVGAFWSQTQNAVDLRDVNEGIVKSLVFGIACSLIAVFEGFQCEPTPEGVGLATTRTVVTSSVMVLLLNYLLTAAFLTRS